MVVVKEELSILVRRIISFVITLIILGIINAVLVRLPAMDIFVYDSITIADIASTIIAVIVVAIIVIFGKDISIRLEKVIPDFPELNPIIYNIAILTAIIIAYREFEGIFIPLLDKNWIIWVYPVVFLCTAIFPVYQLTAVLFKSSGKLADLIMKEETMTSRDTVVCPACGHSVVMSKFCCECGHKLSMSNVCLKCGSALTPGARFCIRCGAEVSEPKAAPQSQSVSEPAHQSQTEPEPQPQALKNVCPHCKTELSPGDRFCTNCGADVSDIT